jgi:microcystin-dependent protein
MSSLLRIKRSGVAGKVPQLSDLALGELAINTHDGRLFARKDNGTASIVEIGDGVPSGVIAMWSGPSSNIPLGWVLCNGANGTPDLRDRFIVGAASSYVVGATGGQNAISQVPAHSHNVSGNTSNTGAHSHTGSTSNTGNHRHASLTVYNRARSSDNKNYISGIESRSSQGIQGNSKNAFALTGAHSHNFSTNTTGAHSHSFSATTSTVGTASVDTRPPYYALCFIMKV